MSSRNKEQQDYKVPGLERGLAILTLFDQHTRALSASEIARRLSLPRSTVYRIVVTLESLGFLELNGANHEYSLGRGVLRLGFEYLASLEMVDLCQPILYRLAETIGFPVNLAILDERSVVYVARALVPNSLTGAMNVGSRLPAHATTVGRLLLSDYSLEQLRELYPEETLEASSVNTPKTVEALYELISASKSEDALIGESYFEDGYTSVAAVVRDKTGQIVSVISAIIPSSSLDETQRDFLKTQVASSAQELSARLK